MAKRCYSFRVKARLFVPCFEYRCGDGIGNNNKHVFHIGQELKKIGDEVNMQYEMVYLLGKLFKDFGADNVICIVLSGLQGVTLANRWFS